MPPTIAEVLKQSGLTDEQIAALDAKVMSGLTQVVSTAAQTLEQAELAKRAQQKTYEDEIAPALNNWANEKANYDAKIAAYDAALKSAKEGGFTVPPILDTPPTATPGRTPDGKFVAGANQVPGSPAFEKKLTDDIANAFSFAADTQWKYRTLFGTEMPDSPTVIIREATAQRMSPSDYAAKKYGFAEKEATKAAEEKKKYEDVIRADQKAKDDKEWAEKVGSNPNIRQAEVSRFSEISKAVQKGERKDTMTMTPEQRRDYTRQQIRKDMAANETVQ